MVQANSATCFEDLEFGAGHGMNRQARTKYENGYGASVVIGPYTYGGEAGLYELAVLDGDGLCYETPITNDVIGHLKPSEVTELLQRIAALPQKVSVES